MWNMNSIDSKILTFFISKKELSSASGKMPSTKCNNKCTGSANMSWFEIIPCTWFVDVYFAVFKIFLQVKKCTLWLFQNCDLFKIVASVDFMWMLSFRWKEVGTSGNIVFFINSVGKTNVCRSLLYLKNSRNKWCSFLQTYAVWEINAFSKAAFFFSVEKEYWENIFFTLSTNHNGIVELIKY